MSYSLYKKRVTMKNEKLPKATIGANNPPPCQSEYVIEMLNITKVFPGIKANDNITLQLKRGEIHALLGENGAGKSTLMSVLFGMYQPDEGVILKDGQEVQIKDPNDATALGIGMVHQHFKLVECFTVLDNIILGAEDTGPFGVVKKTDARKKVQKLIDLYHLNVDLNAKVENITVGMQQRTEILKMLFRDNNILIFDEPTAVLTPQEIDELMQIMRNLANEGKSILFITHKLNEIMAVSNRCTVLRKGKCIGTVNTDQTTKEDLAQMMVGHTVNFNVEKTEATPTQPVLTVNNLCVQNNEHKKLAVNNVSFNVRSGEIVCIAGIDGNGQTELIHGITGLCPVISGSVNLNGKDITKKTVRYRNSHGLSHIPEDRHKHGLVLDFSLQENLVLQRYYEDEFQKFHFIRFDKVWSFSNQLINNFDVRCGQGPTTLVRSMSGGNQQKAIVAREMERDHNLLIAVQPTRGLDVGAIEYIHKQIVSERDHGKAILLVSLELDEVMSLADRILVIYEGEIVAEFNAKSVTTTELGLYMSGAKRQEVSSTSKEEC